MFYSFIELSGPRPLQSSEISVYSRLGDTGPSRARSEASREELWMFTKRYRL
jgi:hypothetical protein